MSIFNPTNPVDNDLVDRIVDGGLTPAELREAIDRLEHEHDGWKRCALAFMEAQCWRESFRALDDSSVSPSADPAVGLPAAKTLRSGRHWIRRSIAAAIMAGSFSLGWVSHLARLAPLANQPSTARLNAHPSVPADTPRANRPDHAGEHQVAKSHLVSRRSVERASVPTVNEVIQAVARLHIGPQSTGADVPILAGPGINETWLKEQPPPVTEYGKVVLARQGYQVDQRRRFITTTLPDGRRVAVPIDQVQIRYTGNDPL